MISYKEFKDGLYRIFSEDKSLNSIPFADLIGAIPKVNEIKDIKRGSVVLVRADLDVPIENGVVVEPSRITSSLPTIKYCIGQGWTVVLFGHVGRDKKNTALPICNLLTTELGFDVELISDWIDEASMTLTDAAVSKLNNAKAGSVYVLENTRKYAIETALWTAKEEDFEEICKKMYSLAKDVKERLTSAEINEGFAASNLDFSSVAIPLLMSKTAMGFYIRDEMNYIERVRNANMVVFSGLKIDKLNDLEDALKRGHIRWIISAGSLAMALLKGRAELNGENFSLGRAETDEKEKFYISRERIEQGKRIVEHCRKNGVELVLPVDFVLENGEVADQIPAGKAQFEVGPKTRVLFEEKIRDYISKSKASPETSVVFYNGVFGKFENPKFEASTREFISHLKKMTETGIETYVGGGEGRMALLKYGGVEDVTHAFTAGGTILKSLSDQHIPYLKAMYLQNKQP